MTGVLSSLGLSTVDDPTAKDAKALQGDLVCTREARGGKELTKAELNEMNKRLMVKGNKFVMKRVVNEKLGTYDGRFELDAAQSPKRFEWTGKGPDGSATELMGIYQLTGDMFRLRYVFAGPDAKQPTNFDVPEKGRGLLLEFKRDKN
jgi:uncharacterized protein (TIGR03067 family)